ncbi:MAG: hypothetical protein U0Y08_07085 [Bacteroidia bacterium]
MKKLSFLLLMLFIAVIQPAESATYYAVVTGPWNATTTWSTGGCGTFVTPAVTPGAGDNVIVCLGVTVTVNVNVSVANVTVNNGGVLQNGGASTTNKSLTVTGTLTVSNGGTLIQNSVLNPSTTLFAGVESFGPSSQVTVSNWYLPTQPLITSVNSNFGSVSLNWVTGANWWKNDGLGTTRSIAGNLTVGAGCQTFLDSTNTNVTVPVPGNLTVNGKLRVKNTNSGNVTFNVTGNSSVGPVGDFSGIYGGTGNLVFTTNNLTSATGGTFNGINAGTGNVNIAIAGTFTCAGNFYGINSPLLLNNGVPSITMFALAYTGGIFMASNAHNSGGTATVSVTSHATVSFTNATDKIWLLGTSAVAGSNVTTALNLTVGGNLSIGGLSTCEFKTSETFGAENIVVNGTFTCTNANTWFNGGVNEASGHRVTATLGGFVMSGGNAWFSENASDSTLITVNGNVQLSGGTFILKSSTGYARMIVNGNYAQNLVGSVMYMHGPDRLGVAAPGNNYTDLKVNGTFAHNGGIMYFDVADSPAEQRVYINGNAYTINNVAQMLRAGAGTSAYFARIYFEYAGIVTYFRGGSHNIRQCKQTIRNGCTLNVTSGPLQISSHNTAAVDFLTIESGGRLNIGSSQISSDSAFTYTGVTVADGGTLALSNTNGLYDNTVNAVLRSTGNMNYFLGALSTIEYNNNTFGRVSGINVGVATLPQHKYGILEINHTGPAGTWVSPTYMPSFTNAVYIRTQLKITNGEFNLADASGSPANSGRYVYIENPSPTALVRTGGYIRSEVQDHSGRIVWTINNVAGTYTIPWGVSAADYIPLTYQLTGGSVGTVSFSTYRTPANNLPWPPGVNNLTSHIGLSPDNRTATVDRFWRMSNTGSAPVLNLTFKYIATEVPGIPFNVPAQMRAHSYNLVSNIWQAATPGQTASAYSVVVPNAGANANWAIASLASPLPVEWLYVKAQPSGQSSVNVKWATATETDCDYFTVWKLDQDGSKKPLGMVKGQGTTTQISEYQFSDISPVQGMNYYQISQSDINGSTTWSDIAAFGFTRSENVTCWYHGTDNTLHIQRNTDGPAMVSVTDLSGRILSKQEVNGKNSEIAMMPCLQGQVVLILIDDSRGRREVVKACF